MSIDSCSHEWRKVHEELVIGGHFPIGWRCRKCNKFVSLTELTPAGLPGIVINEHELVGPHGLGGFTSSGDKYKRQILRQNGELEIEK